MRRTTRLGLLYLTSLAGCAAPTVMLRPGAERVVLVERAPQAPSVGLVLGVHGSGCGWSGKRGNREGAIASLKNNAVRKGADQVQITAELPPYADVYCKRQVFTVQGIGYVTRQKTLSLTPAQAKAPGPARQQDTSGAEAAPSPVAPAAAQ